MKKTLLFAGTFLLGFSAVTANAYTIKPLGNCEAVGNDLEIDNEIAGVAILGTDLSGDLFRRDLVRVVGTGVTDGRYVIVLCKDQGQDQGAAVVISQGEMNTFKRQEREFFDQDFFK